MNNQRMIAAALIAFGSGLVLSSAFGAEADASGGTRRNERGPADKIRDIRAVIRDVDPVLAQLETGLADGRLGPIDITRAVQTYLSRSGVT